MSGQAPDPEGAEDGRRTRELGREDVISSFMRAAPKLNLSDLKVLIVDDDDAVRALVEHILREDGYATTCVTDRASALAALDTDPFDIVLVDKNLRDGSGIDVVRHALSLRRSCVALVMTAYANAGSVVEALRLGASDYLVKPFDDIELVRSAVRRAARVLGLERQNAQLVSALRASNEALAALAVRDPLTKLFNHAYLQEMLEREVSRSKRHSLVFSFAFIDIHDFRQVNESLGHVAGDSILQLFARLLHGVAASAGEDAHAGEGSIAARFGGDKFALLLPAMSKEQAVAVAKQLCTSVEAFDFAGRGFPAQSLSIGVAAYPEDGTDRAELLGAAELALYAAKLGNRRVVAYSPALSRLHGGDSSSKQRAQQARALERAIMERAFDFVYQPIVTADGAVFAYEALVRPRQEEFPNPHVLVATAERAGQLGPLGRALRECNMEALRLLPDPAQLMFINLHPRELYEPEFVAVEPFLAEWADRIVFELTEVERIEDYKLVREVITWLRSFGFRIALDDLGAGYSGLNSLAMLEPDFVKLDMDLVRHANDDARTRRLIRHIVEFAGGERIKVVAEGIETIDERDTVVGLGVHLLQGYLFGRGEPIPPKS